MAVVQSLGRLADLEVGWWPAASYGALRLYDRYYYDYATLYREQPNVRTCVDFLARNIAQLGLHVFRRRGETDRERLRDHPLAQLLEQPLPVEFKISYFRLIQSLMGDLGVYFNAFWLKVRANGELGLLRVPAPYITPKGRLVGTGYEINVGGKLVTVQPTEIVHVWGYNPENPIWGLSPLETLRRVLAEEAAAGDYREHFWANAARMGGIIERPREAPDWSPEARARFKAEFEALYSGAESSGKTAILEEGMSWKQASFDAQQSEYLGGRRLTREECARAYHIPLPMVGILEHATFSNIKEQHKNLYQDCLGPWLAMIEQDVGLQLLPEFEDRQGVYVEFNIAEKLQGSFEEQMQSLQAAVGRPWMEANEARARMNLPSLPEGDGLAMPLNVLIGGQASPRDSEPKGPTVPKGRHSPERCMECSKPPTIVVLWAEGMARAWFCDDCYRTWKEADASHDVVAEHRLRDGEKPTDWMPTPPSGKAAGEREIDPTQPRLRERHVEKWGQVLSAYFGRQQQTILSRVPAKRAKAAKASIEDVWRDAERWDRELGADLFRLSKATATVWAQYVAELMQAQVDPDLMDEYLLESARIGAEEVNRATREQVEAAVGEEKPHDAVRHVFEVALGARVLEIARGRVTGASSFGAHEGARASGLKRKTWQVNSSNPRPAHAALNGVTVEIGELFPGVGMRWPGDPAGGAENNSNCTCSVRFGR